MHVLRGYALDGNNSRTKRLDDDPREHEHGAQLLFGDLAAFVVGVGLCLYFSRVSAKQGILTSLGCLFSQCCLSEATLSISCKHCLRNDASATLYKPGTFTC